MGLLGYSCAWPGKHQVATLKDSAKVLNKIDFFCVLNQVVQPVVIRVSLPFEISPDVEVFVRVWQTTKSERAHENN